MGKDKGKNAIADSTTYNAKGTIIHAQLPCCLRHIVHFLMAAVRAEVRVMVVGEHTKDPFDVGVIPLDRLDAGK